MTPSTVTETPSPATAVERQRTRAACEECRRRKLRCDGQQPKCGVCRTSGLRCEVTSRDTRGPKKGHIKALKNRVLELEALLKGRHSAHQPQQQGFDDIPVPALSVDAWKDAGDEFDQTSTLTGPAFTSELDTLLRSNHPPSVPTISWASPLQTHLTDPVKAELDQLYMDRVHASIPIIHQRRYASWSKSATKTPSQTCLQLSMWTLATLLSTQFQHMTDPLYHETKQTLESLSIDNDGSGSCEVELVQAWVLTVVCESMRTLHRQAWMSAGRVFRLVQALRLHEIDSPNKAPIEADAEFLAREEKRRVFWMAYLLDHLFSMRNDWPVTLNEHVICTRLPVSDTDFQSGRHVTAPFLSEAMTEPDSRVRSTFNECLLLVTISGRCLLRDQQSTISQLFGKQKPNPLEHSRWLDDILTSRLQVLAECYPSPAETSDPMLLFAHILAQATVIYHCRGMLPTAGDQSVLAEPDVSEWQHRALTASECTVRLAKRLRDLHFSKIHPLMPFPLFISGEFLYDNRFRHGSFLSCLRELVDVFGQLPNVNDHQQSYMDLLSRSCISTSTELHHSATG